VPRWENGLPVIEERKITAELIEASLNVSASEAKSIHKTLVVEEWIFPDKLVPSRKGMALAQHVDRPPLPREIALAILDRVLDWADHINADPAERVKLKAIRLFGSLERGEAEVGDIDLFLEFTTFDLGEDLQPEDMERESELAKDLRNISECISPSDELSRQMMSDVASRQIFPRPSSGSK
jgi:predicted nucleotidyltransferase